MDITEYLQRQKEHLGQQVRSVRDFAVFDFDYVPEQPLVRDEGKRLIDELLRFEITGIPTHYVIIGSRGSGKTLTLRYLQRIIPQHASLNIAYANCREHNTSFKILAHVLNLRARGASLAELFDRFIASCTRRTVLILDEIDLMSAKDPRREILYLLSRAERPVMVLALANNPHVLKELDAATRSSLQPVPMHFRSYDAAQIAEILRNRAQRGLQRIDEALIAEIAGLAVRRTNADARVAIKTLYYAVTQPEATLIDNFERARRDTVIDVIHDLPDQTLLILRAIRNASTDFARDIHTR